MKLLGLQNQEILPTSLHINHGGLQYAISPERQLMVEYCFVASPIEGLF